MPRPSRVLWLISFLLLGWAGISAFFGLMYVAQSAHGSDVFRDDVMVPFVALERGGAFNHDSAAAVLNMPPYAGTTPAERATFEQDVSFKASFHLTDDVNDRVLRDWGRVITVAWMNAGVCLVLACGLGFQAWRVADQYE